ncbi:hypothetical protein [Halobaculum sp. MBLA0143]|uniref:DUF7504 family protein n=1 Tax=Halobaculum sp. MBLA0143 TaxID=3079933 RepID=UPI00352632B3
MSSDRRGPERPGSDNGSQRRVTNGDAGESGDGERATRDGDTSLEVALDGVSASDESRATSEAEAAVAERLTAEAAAHRGVDPDALTPVGEAVDLTLATAMLSGARDSRWGVGDALAPSVTSGHLRFVWDGLVVTLHADGRLTFPDGGSLVTPVVDEGRLSVPELCSHAGVGPTDLVSVGGTATAAADAVFDYLLDAGQRATVVSTTRATEEFRATVTGETTVLDCTGARVPDGVGDATAADERPDTAGATTAGATPSHSGHGRVVSLDSCTDLTTLGSNIVATTEPRRDENVVFGFHSLTHLGLSQSARAVGQFLHVLAGKLRGWDAGGVWHGTPVTVETGTVLQTVDYRVETRQRKHGPEARVRSRRDVPTGWLPLAVE